MAFSVLDLPVDPRSPGVVRSTSLVKNSSSNKLGALGARSASAKESFASRKHFPGSFVYYKSDLLTVNRSRRSLLLFVKRRSEWRNRAGKFCKARST
jgi:hypothetical protein